MALTDIKIRSIKPRDKAYKLSDEKGLYLYIAPNGLKSWRIKYRFAGKEKRLCIGVYPDVSLANARDKRDDARKLLANDVDPGVVKQSSKRSARVAAVNSFEAVAREWHAKCASKKWTPKHAERILTRLHQK